jgi:beta-phosphoglucomutase-like phosphatase (HAD superfamily)
MRGASALVKALAAAGIPMAIATSSQQDAMEVKRMNNENIFSPMRAIVTGDDPAVRRGKPSPDIFLEAASRLGVEPSECLVFEDSMTGVLAGKAAGCQVVAIPDPRSDKVEFLETADCVLRSLEDFNGDSFGIEGVSLRTSAAKERRRSRRD